MVITNASLKFADSQAALTTAPDFQCQVNSAAINANANLQTVPATFCAGESQVPAASGYELALTYLQDWTVAAGAGISFYLWDNDAAAKYFSLSLAGTTGPPLATGQCRIVAGTYGGDAGTPLQADVVLPIQGKPTITKPTALMAEDEEVAVA